MAVGVSVHRCVDVLCLGMHVHVCGLFLHSGMYVMLIQWVLCVPIGVDV